MQLGLCGADPFLKLNTAQEMPETEFGEELKCNNIIICLAISGWTIYGHMILLMTLVALHFTDCWLLGGSRKQQTLSSRNKMPQVIFNRRQRDVWVRGTAYACSDSKICRQNKLMI